MWAVIWMPFAAGPKKLAMVLAASGDEAKWLALGHWGLEPDPMEGVCSVALIPHVGGARVVFSA